MQNAFTLMQQREYLDAAWERQLKLCTAWDRYYNRWPKPLARTETDPQGADNVIYNLAGLAVKKGVTFLFGTKPLDFEVNAIRESPEEQWLQECLETNRGMEFFTDLGTNGGVCGQVFVRLRQPEPVRNGHEFPRVLLWDPANVEVATDPEDYERAIRFTNTWHGVDPETAKAAAYRQRVVLEGARWVIYDEISRGDSSAWEPRRPPETWPYPWCPVLTCKNLPNPNEFWGLSDMEEEVLQANQAINFTASNSNRINRVHGHPTQWGRGFSAGQIPKDVDRAILLPSPQAELHLLEMQNGLEPGLALLRVQLELFHELACLPEVATGKVEDLGNLSGLALQILYGPIIERTGLKRISYGRLLSELGARLLELGGKGAGHKVKPQWPSVLPTDRAGEAETALSLDQLGVSRDTLLTELGYDPAAEAKKREQQDRDALKLRAEQLKQFDQDGPPDDEEDDEQ